MDTPRDGERIPRIPLVLLLAITLAYLLASIYMAAFVFPREPVLDYGIGTTTRSTLWAGPIGGLRDLGGGGAYFGVLAYLLGSGIFLWLIKAALFAQRRAIRIWCTIGALAWWLLSGAAFYGPGYSGL